MEYYLASNLEPLKAICDGRLFDEISKIAADVESNVVAYSISEGTNIDDIQILFSNVYTKVERFSFRNFGHFKSLNRFNDYIKESIEYGAGISEFYVEDFLELKSFYLKSVKATA